LPRLGVGVRWSAALALTYGLGTIALPFANHFFSHQLAAALLFGAFVLLYRARHGELAERYALLAGGLLGCAVITEYPTALLALALGIYGLQGPAAQSPPQRARRRSPSPPRAGRGFPIAAVTTDPARWRRALRLAAGATPALLVGGLYNTLAFGGPLGTGYAHLAGPEIFRSGQAQGVFGIT